MMCEDGGQGLLSDYQALLHQALLRFQFVEEALRMYLELSYLVIRKQVKDYFPFAYSRKDVERDSLGGLVSKFRKLNGNRELIKELLAIIPERNHCAHEALLMTADELRDASYLSKEASKMKKVADRAGACCEALFRELKQLEVMRDGMASRLRKDEGQQSPESV